MKYNKNHMQKILNDPLPQLPEDERIYLNVPYQERNFAKITNCGFDKEKKELFNALENCDVLLNDCVNQEIEIKDLYIEEGQTVDEKTGEVRPKYRTIIFDKAGQTYAKGSYGIFNVLKKIVNIYGLPETWEKPLKVKVSKRPIKDGKQSLTLILL